jgi:transcriptional regulator with XRE-family HTH domain
MTNIPTHRRARGLVEIEIGKRIRAQRLLVGVTQRTLASAVGIAWQQVHKYERGISRIGASRLAAIADALDAPISYFFGDVLAQASQPMPNDLMERPETLRLMRLK